MFKIQVNKINQYNIVTNSWSGDIPLTNKNIIFRKEWTRAGKKYGFIPIFENRDDDSVAIIELVFEKEEDAVAMCLTTLR